MNLSENSLISQNAFFFFFAKISIQIICIYIKNRFLYAGVMWKSNQLISQKEKIMENKPSMSRVERLHREKVTRYSIRKYSFGAASVAVAALFMFLGNGAVSADMTAVQPQDASEIKVKPTDEHSGSDKVQEDTTKQVDNTVVAEATAKPEEPATPALDKTKLANYIAEIEAKLANGTYENKTEESVAVLKADLEAAKATLANATTQAELKKLTANLSLQLTLD